MKQKRLKLAVLLFALTFVVGAAFAATNGMLVFGGTVRINSVGVVEDVRLEFTHASISCAFGQASSEIVVVDGRQHLTYESIIDYCPTFYWPDVMSQVDFQIRNTGNVPVEFLQFTYDMGLNQFVEIFLQDDYNQSLHAVLPTLHNHPQSGSMIIQPGAIVTGQILFSTLSGPFPSDFTEIVFSHSFSLAYQSVR